MEKKILFIWIPKTGGSTIHLLFKFNQIYINNSLDLNYNYNFTNDCNATFGHADINILLEKNIISKTFYNNAFKFCIVRNPYDRTVSLFFYNNINKKYTFEEFIIYLFNNKEKIPKNSSVNSSVYGDLNNQWNPMYTWIPDDIDKIYYFENYSNIFEDIKKNTNTVIDFSSIPIINKTEHLYYKSYYNKEIADLVYEMYKIDFEKFGYSKDL
jgi:hypothetical protein